MCLRFSVLSLLGFLIAASSAPGQVPVRGTLLGAGGAPMARAHVVVGGGPSDITLTAEADAEGRFALRLPASGGYSLYAMGVHHQTQGVPLVVTDEDAVELSIRLRPMDFQTDFAQARVIGHFNDFSREEGAVPLAKQTDGTYAATVQTEADTLAYQLLSLRQAPTAGTAADRYAFNSNGPLWDDWSEYASVLDAAGGAVQITLDPSQLPEGDAPFALRSGSERIERIAAVYVEVEALERRIGVMSRSAGDEALRGVGNIQEPFKRRIRQEQDPLVRQWMLLRYFDELMASEADSALARQALQEVPPTSPFWSFEALSDVGASNLIFSIAQSASVPSQVRAYMDETIAEHPDPGVRRHFLYRAVGMADYAGDQPRKWRYYDRIMAEHGDTRQAEWLRRDFSKERAIQPYRPAPEFSFGALKDSAQTYTDEKLRGQVYLIDFWGTWCAPCIKEMPHLHEAYQTYHDQGFEILSVAFLDAPEDVRQFREERYPMPWLHTVVPQEEDRSVRALFEITSFPRPILVDETGTIIATDEQLRGEKLLEHVEQAIAEQQAEQ